MVTADTVRKANATYYSSRPLIAVLVGATSGIGEHSARTLAKIYSTSSQPLRLYIVGRNAAAAGKIIADCSAVCPNGTFRFVKADDLTLIKDVDKVCADLMKVERDAAVQKGDVARIDVLLMTQGQLNFGGRQETSEGLDRSLSLIYYSRIRFILQLQPLLAASENPAHVISVFGAGLEGPLHLSDLSLRDPKNYGLVRQRSHNAHFTTMAFEHLAREYPDLSFVHVFPGLVVTPAFSDPTFPWWVKVVWAVAGPLVRLFFAVSEEEAGERMVFLATERFVPAADAADKDKMGKVVDGTDGKRGSGAYAVGQDGEVVKAKVDYPKLREEGFEKVVWEHTMKAFQEIEGGRKFTG